MSVPIVEFGGNLEVRSCQRPEPAQRSHLVVRCRTG